VRAARIVEALAVLEQVSAGVITGGVDMVTNALDLERVEELSIGAVSQQSPLRLIDGVIPDLAGAAW
jgi:hypothetical protein